MFFLPLPKCDLHQVCVYFPITDHYTHEQDNALHQKSKARQKVETVYGDDPGVIQYDKQSNYYRHNKCNQKITGWLKMMFEIGNCRISSNQKNGYDVIYKNNI